MPLLMTVLLTVVQVSFWYYGRALATAAAQHGLDATRVATGSEESGKETIEQFLEQTGGLDITSISIVRTTEDATVTVEGDVVQVVPFFEVPVSVTLEASVERVVE